MQIFFPYHLFLYNKTKTQFELKLQVKIIPTLFNQSCLLWYKKHYNPVYSPVSLVCRIFQGKRLC